MKLLAKARKQLLAVLHCISFKYVYWKIAYHHFVIPRGLTSLLDLTLLLSIINVILLLSMFDPRNIIWDLPELATILFILNHLKIKCVPSQSSLFKFWWAWLYCCIIGKLQTSVSWMKNINSIIKSLNNTGPRTEPCATHLNISR